MRRGTRSNPDNGGNAAGPSDASETGVSSSGEEYDIPQTDTVQPVLEPSPAEPGSGQAETTEKTVKSSQVLSGPDPAPTAAATHLERVLVDMTNALREVTARSIAQEDSMGQLQERLSKVEWEASQPQGPSAQKAQVPYQPTEDGNRSDGEYWHSELSEGERAPRSKSAPQPVARSAAARSRAHRPVERSLKVAEYEVYPTSVAYKIYKSALEHARCKKIGDGSFFDSKRTWERLLKDFPIMESSERRLLPYAFEKDARRVYEEVASMHTEASAAELWGLLETRLCNKTHRSALQDKFFEMRWSEKKESVAQYAERLRSASMALPTPIEGDVLLNRFKAGLPQKLQDQAVLVMGDFDTVVSSVSRLSTAQQNLHRESIREVKEHTGHGAPQQPEGSNASNESRFAHVKCHFCLQLGHIARFCDKKKALKGKEYTARPASRPEQGNGLGGATPPVRK